MSEYDGIRGRVHMKPTMLGWVGMHYPEPFVRDRLALTHRVRNILMWTTKRYIADFGYWTRESLR